MSAVVPKNRKRRALTIANVLDIKPKKVLTVANELLSILLGIDVEPVGFWLFYGKEKNGKTAFALEVANAISQGGERVIYIPAEEKTKGTFRASVRRSKLTRGNKNILFDPYCTSIKDIVEIYKSPRQPNILIIDNIKSFQNEFRNNKELLEWFKTEMAHKLIIFLAHERDNEPYPAPAPDIAIWADVIARIVGLKVEIISRYENGGGEYIITEKAEEFHGSIIFNKQTGGDMTINERAIIEERYRQYIINCNNGDHEANSELIADLFEDLKFQDKKLDEQLIEINNQNN